MGLLERIRADRDPVPARSADGYISNFLIPASQYTPGTNVVQRLASGELASVASTLPAYLAAVSRCPPAFSAQLVRSTVLQQARFQFRNRPGSSRPRQTFGTKELGTVEDPWVNAQTADLIGLMEWHAGLAGNAFVTRQRSRLRVLRPDWTYVVYGSQAEPDDPAGALDAELVGYVYQPGGLNSGRGKPRSLLPAEVAHWAPLPDPTSDFGLGMSWLTPALRDIQADRIMTEHKLRFFQNGATPGLVVSGIQAESLEEFNSIVDVLEANHSGEHNAYRTLYLTAGADASVLGSNLQQVDFLNVQAIGETRITALSRVPAPILGFSEGLKGASLNAGNLAISRRMFADTFVFPWLASISGALSSILTIPPGAELWFDTTDIPLLREDARDAAEIEEIKARTIAALVKEGFTAESAIAAVMGQDMRLLDHSGLVSVQLQPPGVLAPDGSQELPTGTPLDQLVPDAGGTPS